MQLQRPSLIQGQKLVMNPQVLQSIRLMELPVMDLRERIEEELERNPALEVLEDRSTVSIDDATAPSKEDREEYEYFEATSDSGFVSKGGEAAADERRRFIEGALSRSETLQEHLLWQLRLEPADGEIRRICELLIQNLNDDGFHKEPVRLLLRKEKDSLIKKALEIVQGLEPVGTCAADYRESLKIQIEHLPDAPKGIIKALSYLELLERGKISEAAKKMGCSEDEASAIFEKIKELSPFPGRQFTSEEIIYVVPDIKVIRLESEKEGEFRAPDIEVVKQDDEQEGVQEGEFAILLNGEVFPVLGINPSFIKADGDSAAQVRDFARENIREARWFINSINQRNHTLLRVSRAIVEFQRSFFINGPKFLAPLTLGDIAGQLGLHETTVSRTANGKYMQTEWGIFEIRHFFSNSISGTGSGGSVHSKEGVKEIIREIIGSESGRLSDQDISEMLTKQGISLARRTVAKYRKELDLASSFDR
jgi:RNA polymerase sigma-54 factor